MIQKKDKNKIRKARHLRVRKKIMGTAERPRLSVYRSLSNMYTQLIDDVSGHTLVSVSTLDASVKEKIGEMNKSQAAKEVGKATAERAKAAGITSVVFDRGGYLYTGRIAEVAAGAREGGLEF